MKIFLLSVPHIPELNSRNYLPSLTIKDFKKKIATLISEETKYRIDVNGYISIISEDKDELMNFAVEKIWNKLPELDSNGDSFEREIYGRMIKVEIYRVKETVVTETY